MAGDAREAILNRVRQALSRPAPEPHWMHEPIPSAPWFPLPADAEAARSARFKSEFTAIQGEWREAGSIDAARKLLTEWFQQQTISSSIAPKCERLKPILDGLTGVRWIERAEKSHAGWERFDVGVTPAEALVAESGTILVSAKSSGRAMSVLPPTHWVIATADDVVPDIESSMRRLRARYGEQLPSTLSWISGPSRTADIEKILVLGAHGPRKLFVLMLPAGSLPRD